MCKEKTRKIATNLYLRNVLYLSHTFRSPLGNNCLRTEQSTTKSHHLSSIHKLTGVAVVCLTFGLCFFLFVCIYEEKPISFLDFEAKIWSMVG